MCGEFMSGTILGNLIVTWCTFCLLCTHHSVNNFPHLEFQRCNYYPSAVKIKPHITQTTLDTMCVHVHYIIEVTMM